MEGQWGEICNTFIGVMTRMKKNAFFTEMTRKLMICCRVIHDDLFAKNKD